MNTYTKWEYQQVDANFANLNVLGRAGWELCLFRNINGYTFYILKRPIVEQTNSIENVEKAVEILDSIKKAKKKLATPQFKVGDWVTQHTWETAYLVSKVTDNSISIWSDGVETEYTHFEFFSLAPKDMPKDKSSYNPAEKIKVGDWVIHKNKAWGWSYEVAKIKNGKAFLWVNKDILDMPYDIANLVICDNFEKYPKHDGKPIENKPAKKVNPNNPQNIRKGDWVCVGKNNPRCFKVFSVGGHKVYLYFQNKFYGCTYNLKDIYKPSAEELKFKTKIF